MCGKADNIPGLKGIGKKTATTLIQSFGDLEAIYENIDNIGKATSSSGSRFFFFFLIIVLIPLPVAFNSSTITTISSESWIAFFLCIISATITTSSWGVKNLYCVNLCIIIKTNTHVYRLKFTVDSCYSDQAIT